MSTQAKVGIGAVLRRWAVNAIDSTTGIWQEVAEVTAISFPGINREVIETYRLNNEDDYVNKLQGVLNAGQLTFTCNYTKAQFDKLKEEIETRGNNDYQLELPGGECLEFEGFITELPIDPIGSDDTIQQEIVIEIDGRPDFVSSPSSQP
jgi:hypothetical protein